MFKSEGCMTLGTDADEYRQGQIRAAAWITTGGDLRRDPPRSTEAFENGFCDTLAAERERIRKDPLAVPVPMAARL